MTIFMASHDIAEAFRLGTRLIVFDKVRHDPQHPTAYGATITWRPAPKNCKPLNDVAPPHLIETKIAEEERTAHVLPFAERSRAS
jgi:NitT/TauT family transport system ATP-binding protein